MEKLLIILLAIASLSFTAEKLQTSEEVSVGLSGWLCVDGFRAELLKENPTPNCDSDPCLICSHQSFEGKWMPLAKKSESALLLIENNKTFLGGLLEKMEIDRILIMNEKEEVLQTHKSSSPALIRLEVPTNIKVIVRLENDRGESFQFAL